MWILEGGPGLLVDDRYVERAILKCAMIHHRHGSKRIVVWSNHRIRAFPVFDGEIGRSVFRESHFEINSQNEVSILSRKLRWELSLTKLEACYQMRLIARPSRFSFSQYLFAISFVSFV